MLLSVRTSADWRDRRTGLGLGERQGSRPGVHRERAHADAHLLTKSRYFVAAFTAKEHDDLNVNLGEASREIGGTCILRCHVNLSL